MKTKSILMSIVLAGLAAPVSSEAATTVHWGPHGVTAVHAGYYGGWGYGYHGCCYRGGVAAGVAVGAAVGAVAASPRPAYPAPYPYYAYPYAYYPHPYYPYPYGYFPYAYAPR